MVEKSLKQHNICNKDTNKQIFFRIELYSTTELQLKQLIVR